LPSSTSTVDAELIQLVDAAMAEAHRRSASWIACRRGCFHCCLGPFEITAVDAWRLREGWRRLEPGLAGRIADRAAEARAVLGSFPHFRDEDFPNLPCPVLDLETGACELYEHRPIACRLHGPAVRVDDVDLRHCRLNYVGAAADEVEACRVTVDPAGAEDRAVAEFEAGGGGAGRTYIAFAFPGE
jgi:Fe-S-cluster containining protein